MRSCKSSTDLNGVCAPVLSFQRSRVNRSHSISHVGNTHSSPRGVAQLSEKHRLNYDHFTMSPPAYSKPRRIKEGKHASQETFFSKQRCSNTQLSRANISSYYVPQHRTSSTNATRGSSVINRFPKVQKYKGSIRLLEMLSDSSPENPVNIPVKVLWNFFPEEPTELKVTIGQWLYVMYQLHGWAFVKDLHEAKGYVPLEFLTMRVENLQKRPATDIETISRATTNTNKENFVEEKIKNNAKLAGTVSPTNVNRSIPTEQSPSEAVTEISDKQNCFDGQTSNCCTCTCHATHSAMQQVNYKELLDENLEFVSKKIKDNLHLLHSIEKSYSDSDFIESESTSSVTYGGSSSGRFSPTRRGKPTCSPSLSQSVTTISSDDVDDEQLARLPSPDDVSLFTTPRYVTKFEYNDFDISKPSNDQCNNMEIGDREDGRQHETANKFHTITDESTSMCANKEDKNDETTKNETYWPTDDGVYYDNPTYDQTFEIDTECDVGGLYPALSPLSDSSGGSDDIFKTNKFNSDISSNDISFISSNHESYSKYNNNCRHVNKDNRNDTNGIVSVESESENSEHENILEPKDANCCDENENIFVNCQKESSDDEQMLAPENANNEDFIEVIYAPKRRISYVTDKLPEFPSPEMAYTASKADTINKCIPKNPSENTYTQLTRPQAKPRKSILKKSTGQTRDIHYASPDKEASGLFATFNELHVRILCSESDGENDSNKCNSEVSSNETVKHIGKYDATLKYEKASAFL